MGMIKFELTGCLVDPPTFLDVKNRPEIWAKLRLTLRLPSYVKDGERIPGSVRYFTVVAFAPLANRIQNLGLVQGDWVSVQIRDVRANPWIDSRTAPPKARATVELIAETLDLLTRDQAAALLAATRQDNPTADEPAARAAAALSAAG
jgi:hypothetical protein